MFVGFEVGRKGGKARGDGIKKEHECGGGDDAEGGHGERREETEGVFGGEVVDAPDEHDEGDARVEDGIGGTVAVGRSYAHGSGDVGGILESIRGRKEEVASGERREKRGKNNAAALRTQRRGKKEFGQEGWCALLDKIPTRKYGVWGTRQREQ